MNAQERYEQYLDLSAIALKMRAEGVQVDPSRFEQHRKRFRRARNRARRSLQKLAATFGMEDFNPHAPIQVGELFFAHLDVPPTRWTDSGAPSLNHEAAKKLLTHPDIIVRVAARELLKHRKNSKLLKTFIDGLELDGSNKIHPEWKCWGAITRRWSCKGPNLQQVPKPVVRLLKSKDKDGNRRKKVVYPGLRDLYVAAPGRYIIEADYSQLEARIVAILANDKPLLDGYRKGDDVHALNAVMLFGMLTKPLRNLAKLFLYACLYGAEAKTIWHDLVPQFPQLTLTDIIRARDRFFKFHWAIAVWHERERNIVRKRGYIEIPNSGQQITFHLGEPDLNQALNIPVQGTGADLMNRAIIKLDRAIDWKREKILMQIHDAIILETDNPLRTARKLKRYMEEPIMLNGKSHSFPVDFKVGRSWGDAQEMTLGEIAARAKRRRRKKTTRAGKS